MCGKACCDPPDYHDRPTMKTVMDLNFWKLLSQPSHMPDELNVYELKIPNIPYEDLKACCNGYWVSQFSHETFCTMSSITL